MVEPFVRFSVYGIVNCSRTSSIADQLFLCVVPIRFSVLYQKVSAYIVSAGIVISSLSVLSSQTPHLIILITYNLYGNAAWHFVYLLDVPCGVTLIHPKIRISDISITFNIDSGRHADILRILYLAPESICIRKLLGLFPRPFFSVKKPKSLY